MAKITITDMSFYYDKYYFPVFDKINLNIDTGWKLGLIGRNGRGKTTLLKLIHGEIEPSEGIIKKDVKTELYPYELDYSYTKVEDFIKENIGKLKSLEDDIEHLEEEKLTESNEYIEALMKYNDLGGYQITSKIHKELFLMNLDSEILLRDYGSLSGGEQTKIQILILFLKNIDFILLDEPTNHLDYEGRKTLSQYLRKKKGFLVVSHDRMFLDEIIDHVMAINKSSIGIEKGNFASWKKNKDNYEEFEKRRKVNLERKIDRLDEAAANAKNWSMKSNEKKYSYRTNSRSRSISLMSKVKDIERKVQHRQEEKEHLLRDLEIIPSLNIKQKTPEEVLLVEAKKISFSYNQNTLFENLSFKLYQGERMCISGGNGCGKTTLLNLLFSRDKLKTGKIYICEDLEITYCKQIPEIQNGLLRNILCQDLYAKVVDICKLFEVSEEMLLRPLETCSAGELKKIDIAIALATENHLIVLDEPLNYTDIYFREQLEDAIKRYSPTLIYVEHDYEFVRNTATKIIEL